MNRAELLACPECDLLQSDSAIPRPRKALCARCGAILYQRHDNGLERTTALTVAALFLFTIANAFPIVALELQGDRTDATLFGAVAALWSQNMQLVALLVAATAFAFPLLVIATLGWLLFPLRYGQKAPYFGDVYWLLQFAQRFALVDVFVLGALVSYVKLDHLAEVQAGAGMWAFGALMLVMASINSNFDPADLWERASAL